MKERESRMQPRVYGWYSFVTWPPVLALLFAGYLLCTVGFSLRARSLGLGNEPPDTHWWYSAEQLQELLARFGEEGRPLYALSECTLDVVFPFVYCSLFAGLLAHVYPRRAARWLLVLPVLALLGDLSENFHFAHLACRFNDFDNQIATWYWTAVLSTATKFACFTLATLALIVGGVGRLLKQWTSAVTSNGLPGAG
jgi:hypothetical protein